MTEFGYTAMCEQTPVRQLVSDIAAAEDAGFDFAVMSDHYFPWLEEQGHSGYAWAVLGAAAQVTSRIPMMTFVTCPSLRYHPAVVAQKAATIGVLSRAGSPSASAPGKPQRAHHRPGLADGAGPPRETAGERADYPGAKGGEYVNFAGQHFTVERAKLFDLPEQPVRIAIAASGHDSVRMAAELGDGMITAEPDAALVGAFAWGDGKPKPAFTQVPVCYDQDEATARERAWRLWRWATPGWHVMAELPEPRSFDAESQSVTADEVAGMVPCGPDVERHVEAVRKAVDAGYSHVALLQVGADKQGELISWARSELLPALSKRST
jgi:alkanesulfonate monooxygenase SsuD/methylene tetrahydromethanopterin reductase-like flavin-dependent oxidoreductase (luciferase family)